MPRPPHVALQDSFLSIGDALCGQLNTPCRDSRPPCCFYASLPTGPVSSSSTCLKNPLLSVHICCQSHDDRNCCCAVKRFLRLTLIPIRHAGLDPAELRPTPLTSFHSSLLNFHFLHLVLQRGSRVRFLIIAVTTENPPPVAVNSERRPESGTMWQLRSGLMAPFQINGISKRCRLVGTVLSAVLHGGACFTTNYSWSEAMRPFFLRRAEDVCSIAV